MTTPERLIVACMGGWCHVRDRCAHHHSPSRVVSERLCERGREEPEPMLMPPIHVIHRPHEAASAT